jgi:hypothetical protein
MKYLLGWAADFSSDEDVGELIATALAADPSLLPHILPRDRAVERTSRHKHHAGHGDRQRHT